MNKFKDQESLQKAYESLEKEFTRRSQRLRELQGKTEQGTLIELPCKVGDTVYTIEKFGWQDRWRVKKNYCNSITFDGDKFFINREVYEYDGCYGYAFGEDAFLTREEAEKRLKELQE